MESSDGRSCSVSKSESHNTLDAVLVTSFDTKPFSWPLQIESLSFKNRDVNTGFLQTLFRLLKAIFGNLYAIFLTQMKKIWISFAEDVEPEFVSKTKIQVFRISSDISSFKEIFMHFMATCVDISIHSHERASAEMYQAQGAQHWGVKGVKSKKWIPYTTGHLNFNTQSKSDYLTIQGTWTLILTVT